MVGTKTLPRIAGALYVVVVVFSIFSQIVGATMAVPGDAAATAHHLAAHATLFRSSLIVGLVSNTCILVVALILYAVFHRRNPGIALAMVVLNAVGVAISDVNGINHLSALLLATVPGYAAGLGSPASHALVLLALDLGQLGNLIAFLFFGLWLLPLGYLVYESTYFPRLLGVLLMVGGCGYLVADAGNFLSAGVQWRLALYFELAGIAEIVFALWLLIVGARVQAQAATSTAVDAA